MSDRPAARILLAGIIAAMVVAIFILLSQALRDKSEPARFAVACPNVEDPIATGTTPTSEPARWQLDWQLKKTLQ